MKPSANIRYPGRPNYTGPKSGLFLLPFHNTLIAWMPDILKRLETIDKTKSSNEIAWRRRCIVYVKPSELPSSVRKAHATREKAYATWEKAYATWEKALKANNDHLIALLTKHVPDHTWNNKRKELIFK